MSKKSTEYLYGVEATELPSMAAGLQARIDNGMKLLKELLEINIMDRDVVRINDVIKAMEHNTKLLNGAI